MYSKTHTKDDCMEKYVTFVASICTTSAGRIKQQLFSLLNEMQAADRLTHHIKVTRSTVHVLPAHVDLNVIAIAAQADGGQELIAVGVCVVAGAHRPVVAAKQGHRHLCRKCLHLHPNDVT